MKTIIVPTDFQPLQKIQQNMQRGWPIFLAPAWFW